MPVYGWFDISPFEIKQENGEGFHLTPRPGQVTGEFGGFARTVGGTGDVTGLITGDKIEFTIHWSDGKVGAYRGWLYPDGRLRGVSDRLDGISLPGPGFFQFDEPPDERDVGWWSLDGYTWTR
jgi:hypothetical protein